MKTITLKVKRSQRTVEGLTEGRLYEVQGHPHSRNFKYFSVSEKYGLTFKEPGPFSEYTEQQYAEAEKINVEWENEIVRTWVHKAEQVELISMYEGTNYGLDFNAYKIVKVDAWNELQDGSFLINHNGYFNSGLTILTDKPQIDWVKVDPKEIGMIEGSYHAVRGEYFVSKKGTKCFRQGKGPHLLVMDDWGGAFSKYFGGSLQRDKSLYYRRAVSKGGRQGRDFAVVKI